MQQGHACLESMNELSFSINWRDGMAVFSRVRYFL